MDWVNDNACLSENSADLKRIFRYGSRSTTVVKIVERNHFRAQVWELVTEGDWTQWLDHHVSDEDRGLVLVLADCTKSDYSTKATDGPMAISDRLAAMKDRGLSLSKTRRAEILAPFGQVSSGMTGPNENINRSIRDISFSQNAFKDLCERFQVHRTILRALTRSDVPLFQCEKVEMRLPAIVYNYRIPKSLDEDLALSATHFPERGLTFSVIYGSTPNLEARVLQRLNLVRDEASHPLLLPGLLVELELMRHKTLVESNINSVEDEICKLDDYSGGTHIESRKEVEKRRESRRIALLELTYLRTSMTTWTLQLHKMLEHARSLDQNEFSLHVGAAEIKSIIGPRNQSFSSTSTFQNDNLPLNENENENEKERHLLLDKSFEVSDEPNEYCEEQEHYVLAQSNFKLEANVNDEPCDRTWLKAGNNQRKMRNVGAKVQARLADIIAEYDENIRDCTLHADGMTLSTQWSQSETAVEIAMATNRDSRVMRSISLVTMLFLPGTFFATIFSMTFFNWSGDSGKPHVSSYVWIYVVVTMCFTALTVGLWYFFVIFRRSIRAPKDEEKEIGG